MHLKFNLRCIICNSYKPEQQKEPLVCHETPTRSLQSISVDLINGTSYLVTTDPHSDLLELNILTSTTTRELINKLKPYLAGHGLPDRLTTENGPQFDCARYVSEVYSRVSVSTR